MLARGFRMDTRQEACRTSFEHSWDSQKGATSSKAEHLGARMEDACAAPTTVQRYITHYLDKALQCSAPVQES